MGRKAVTPSSGRMEIGSLYDDLSALAGNVQRSMCDGNVVVWADDACRVFAGTVEQAPTVPAHWVAGTYSFGHAHQSIQDDLRALLRERSKDWIVQDSTTVGVTA